MWVWVASSDSGRHCTCVECGMPIRKGVRCLGLSIPSQETRYICVGCLTNILRGILDVRD
jgi:hypothetical protein